MTTAWPVRLRSTHRRGDAAAAGHRDARPGARPASATRPGWSRGTRPSRRVGGAADDFRSWSGGSHRHARQGTCLPFAIEVDGRFAGQVTVNNIVRGSAQFASVGYWLDQDVAGRGVMPRAVAMVIDHCFFTAGLHRIEVAIRPENSNSLRVVEKLDIREVGYAPQVPPHRRRLARPPASTPSPRRRCPDGVLTRLRASGGHQTHEPHSHTRHFATHGLTCDPGCAGDS